MNNFIKQVIEEKFASKAQQRFFYAQAGKGGKKGKKWSKWAKEFSDKTDFDKIPDKVEKEEEVDEIVDKQGNIARSKKKTDFNTKGITQNSTTDEVVKMGGGSMGVHGVHGTHTSLRYWAESDLSKTLGAKDTILQDIPYEDAKDHMEDDLGLDEPEAEERLNNMGYDKKLPNDKVRLVENPKKFMEEYIESVLAKKSKDNDIVSKEEEIEEKEVNPIILKQIKSLKNTLKSHDLSLNDIMKHLNKDDE
jgi:hypothetical protein